MKSIYLYTDIRVDDGKAWDQRTIAWHPEFDKNLLHDYGDECRWNFAVIETFVPGIHQIGKVFAFYQNDDVLGWWEITKPEWAEGLVNWGLG